MNENKLPYKPCLLSMVTKAQRHTIKFIQLMILDSDDFLWSYLISAGFVHMAVVNYLSARCLSDFAWPCSHLWGWYDPPEGQFRYTFMVNTEEQDSHTYALKSLFSSHLPITHFPKQVLSRATRQCGWHWRVTWQKHVFRMVN